MDRRGFLLTALAAALAPPLAAEAQTAERIARWNATIRQPALGLTIPLSLLARTDQVIE